MNTQEKDPLIDENDNVSLRAIVESYDRKSLAHAVQAVRDELAALLREVAS